MKHTGTCNYSRHVPLWMHSAKQFNHLEDTGLHGKCPPPPLPSICFKIDLCLRGRVKKNCTWAQHKVKIVFEIRLHSSAPPRQIKSETLWPPTFPLWHICRCCLRGNSRAQWNRERKTLTQKAIWSSVTNPRSDVSPEWSAAHRFDVSSPGVGIKRPCLRIRGLKTISFKRRLFFFLYL